MLNRKQSSEREKCWQLDGSDFLKVSKRLLKAFDFETAIYLTAILKQEIYNFKNNRLDSEGRFLFKREYVEKTFFLSSKQQRRVSSQLQNKGVISVIRKGQPPCIWVKLNHDVLNKIVGKIDFKNYDLESE
jgi:hypothetical protein